MIQNLKEIYEGQARQERYETSKALFQCKMSEGSPMGAHVIKMMGYIQALEKLGFPINIELAIDVVSQSLPDSFNQFVLNFNMNEINKTLPQLLGMLRTTKSNMKNDGSKSILMVREAKGKGKKSGKVKGLDFGKETALFILKMSRRLKKLEHQSQGLHLRRNLAKGDVNLRVGNGARVAALAVGTYVLSLPSGLVLNLENCYFVPSLTKNIISVSCLDKIGFEWNGVSERRNRTLLDMVRSMMSHTDLLTSFWDYALETTAFTLNRVPSKSVQKTPHEMWTGKRLGMSFMKV
ncbi:hypothetical protein V6N12_045775 [Hibiscus sabdariffa]|uniref:Retrovirus-related Pol polyprotein from transposon TNT 1-94-like beta-barrel domain-containing protein n=1 Tax=Hibiscus sabdariffa TaxID=183260 RepID=A0ABR2G3R3_9ROSI